MDIEKFVANRTAVWADLDALVARAEAEPGELWPHDVHKLVELYRRACSDLNLARSYTANPELIGRLNQLTGRAYRFVYQAGHEKPVVASFVRLVTREIPAAFRRERLVIAIAASAFILGTFFGAAAVLVDRANGARLIPGDFFTESPRQRVERIEHEEERIDSAEKAMLFSSEEHTS